MFLAILAAVVILGSVAAFLADRRTAARVRRAGLIVRIRQGEATQVLLQERSPFAARESRARNLIPYRDHQQATAARRRDELSRHAWRDEPWSLGFVVVACVGTALWVVLFLLQREMDINILVALGYVSPPVFGTVIALVFAVIGVFVSGLLGLHPLLPPWIKPSGRFGRIAAALILAGVSIAFMAYLQKIAVYRSIDQFGTAATTLEKTLDQQEASGATPLEIAVTRAELNDRRERLHVGQTLDRALTMAIPALEMALAAAPIFATELAVIGYYALAANRAGRKRRSLQRAVQAARDEFHTYAIRLLAEAGEPVVTLRKRLAELPQLPEPAPDTPDVPAIEAADTDDQGSAPRPSAA